MWSDYEKCKNCETKITEKNFGVGHQSKGKVEGFCVKCIKEENCYLTIPKVKK